MPFFADGRPVDIVLNPLGVPSRMNLGQIMDTHLGWGAKELGRQLAKLVESGTAMQVVRDDVKSAFNSPEISKLVDSMDDEEFAASVRKLRKGITTRTPVFDGATEEEIWGWMDRAGLNNDGKTVLYDGRTGEAFKNKVTVGVMYMLKLHHLVDEKIHARSTGPYSLVTQQPLGGKAQFGGQRLGEMEVWGLEAYGASYLLQEFLTIKSDDVSDALFAEIKDEMCDRLKARPESAEKIIYVMMIAKYLERIGDHAVNIAEWAIFSVSGMYKDSRLM